MKSTLILLILLSLYLILSFVQFELNIISWSWSAQLVMILAFISSIILRSETK